MDYTQKVTKINAPEVKLKKSDASLRIIDTDLDGASLSPEILQTDKTVRRKSLINKLNHINFKNETVCINFQHVKDKQTISFSAPRNPALANIWCASGPISRISINCSPLTASTILL